MQFFLFYSAVIGFCSGIFLRSLFDIGLPIILWLYLVCLGLCVLWHRYHKTVSAQYVGTLCVFLFLFSCGVLRMEIASWYQIVPQFEDSLETIVALEGTVVREPDVRATSQHLTVVVDGHKLLVTTDRYQDVAYGDTISFKGKLTKPTSFQTDLGRTFDYAGYLKARDISYVVSFARVQVQTQGAGNRIVTLMLSFKHSFMSHIESVIPEPYVGLSEGLLLGVKQALGENLENSFRKTGVIHIVVLSGYNIMLVVIFVMYVLALLVPLRLRLLIGGGTIVLFACMVGLSSTVIRASAMALLALIAKATGRTYAVLRALMITGVLMLLLNPYLLVYDVGFQLSFIATLGLILVSPHIETYVGFMPTKFGLREFLTATVATQIFVTPLLLYQIGQFSVVAVVVNLLVLPMVSIAMLTTFVTGMLGFVSTTLSVLLAYVAYLSLAYIILIVESFARLPFASVTFPEFSFLIVIGAYGIIAYVLWWLIERNKNSASVAFSKLIRWTIVDEEVYITTLASEKTQSSTATSHFFR